MIIDKINSDQLYKIELENTINEVQKSLNVYNQQNVINSGNIENKTQHSKAA